VRCGTNRRFGGSPQRRSPRPRSPRSRPPPRNSRSPAGSSCAGSNASMPAPPPPVKTSCSRRGANGFVTNSTLSTIAADETHRDHAIVEQVIAELKNGPLAHAPSGKFLANPAWLALACLAFNLLRATGAAASARHAKARWATLRTQLVAVAARSRRPPASWCCTCQRTGPGRPRGTPGPPPPLRHPDHPGPQARGTTRRGRAGQTGGYATPPRARPRNHRPTTSPKPQNHRRWILNDVVKPLWPRV